MYPFVKLHESKRYGSPLRTERGSHTVATNAFPQANKVRFKKTRREQQDGEELYFDEGSCLSAQWGSVAEADNLQPPKPRRRAKKASNRKSSDEAESGDSLHTRLSFRPRRKVPSTTAKLENSDSIEEIYIPYILDPPSSAENSDVAIPTPASSTVQASQEVSG